jgi:hypothetical protein
MHCSSDNLIFVVILIIQFWIREAMKLRGIKRYGMGGCITSYQHSKQECKQMYYETIKEHEANMWLRCVIRQTHTHNTQLAARESEHVKCTYLVKPH